METKEYLAKAVGVVTFVFAAFSGYLKGIAPPEEADASSAVGLGSFFVLIILLLVSVLGRNQVQQRHKKTWLALLLVLAIVAVTSGVMYKGKRDRLTFSYPPDRITAEYVAGIVPTSEAQQYFSKGYSASEVVAKFGGMENRQRVWKSESINKAKMLLTVNYLVFVLSLAAAVFGFVELLAGPAAEKLLLGGAPRRGRK